MRFQNVSIVSNCVKLWIPIRRLRRAIKPVPAIKHIV